MQTLGLQIQTVPTNQPDKFKAKINLIPHDSSADAIVGDVIINVNGVTVASNDGILLGSGTSITDIVAAIIQCREGHIVEIDVL